MDENNPNIDTSSWPFLLQNCDQLQVRTNHYTTSTCGFCPFNRPFAEHLRYGVIYLDKPKGTDASTAVSFVRSSLGIKKLAHIGTLDLGTSGNLIVLLNSSTRLCKSLKGYRKEYIAVARLHSTPIVVGGDVFCFIARRLDVFRGAIFQTTNNNVRRRLTSSVIYDIEMMEYKTEENLVVFWVECESQTNISTLCTHFGKILGVRAHLHELKWVWSSFFEENNKTVSSEDVDDASIAKEHFDDESNLRQIVMPVEVLFTGHKRLVVKDYSVDTVCREGKLKISGLLSFESGIEVGEEIVLMTTKGEVIALGIAEMTTAVMATCVDGVVSKIMNVIMDWDTYPKELQVAKKKKKERLISERKPNENAPAWWMRNMDFLPSGGSVITNMAAVTEPEKVHSDVIVKETEKRGWEEVGVSSAVAGSKKMKVSKDGFEVKNVKVVTEKKQKKKKKRREC